MITSRPAEAIGMGGEIGSLAPGRRADVVIWSGDPLEGVERGRSGVHRRRPPAARHPPDPAARPLPLSAAARPARGLSALTPQAGLFLSAIAFVGTHFLLSHPLRATARPRGSANGPFQGIYSLVALLTFGAMIYFYRAIGDEPPLWAAGEVGVDRWRALLMWFGSILFVGSFVGNPALPGRAGRPRAAPHGVFAITRHPMMWGFALWAIVHLMVVATPKALVFDGAILLLALGGSVGQDRKKRKLMGERWHEWTAQTAFVPFARGSPIRALVALIGGTLLFLVATWLHPDAGGLLALDRLNALRRAPMTRKFFGTDGIRGLTNSEPMTAETALRVGMAAGAHFLRGDHRHRVVIGKDTRLSPAT